MGTLKEERTERAVKYGYKAFENSFNCGQSSLAGLLAEFMPENEGKDEVLKAGSIMFGVGNRGETCGAVQGSMMFLGLLYGQDGTTKLLNPSEFTKIHKRVSVGTNFANTFANKWGSTQCKNVHGQIMGKYYNFQNLQELAAFYKDGADKKCQTVVESAIRMVCDLILDENGEIKSL